MLTQIVDLTLRTVLIPPAAPHPLLCALPSGLVGSDNGVGHQEQGAVLLTRHNEVGHVPDPVIKPPPLSWHRLELQVAVVCESDALHLGGHCGHHGLGLLVALVVDHHVADHVGQDASLNKPSKSSDFPTSNVDNSWSVILEKGCDS